MQVAVGVGGSHVDGLCRNIHRGTGGVLLEVVTRLDVALLRLQRLLLAVGFCQSRDGSHIVHRSLTEHRQCRLHIFVHIEHIHGVHAAHHSVV